jgi:hypothetical protein
MDGRTSLSIATVPSAADGHDIGGKWMVMNEQIEPEHIQHNERAVGELPPKQRLKPSFGSNPMQPLKTLPGIRHKVQLPRLFIVCGARKFAHSIAMHERYQLAAELGFNVPVERRTDKSHKHIQIVLHREEPRGKVEHQVVSAVDRAKRTASQEDNLSAIGSAIEEYPRKVIERRRLFHLSENLQFGFSHWFGRKCDSDRNINRTQPFHDPQPQN